MIYEKHLAAAERSAWPLDSAIDWDGIDHATAASERDVHAALHDAALIEGYLPLYAPRLMLRVWDDVDATAVLSLELYEGLRHFTALKRYLDRVGYAAAGDMESTLVRARAGAARSPDETSDVLSELTRFMCSELFAAHFFLRFARRTREPVLRKLLSRMARDEFRHSASAGDLLAERVRKDSTAVTRILAAAESFRHYGSDVVEVPVAERNDFDSILAMNRKVRQVCGLAPTEHLEKAVCDEAR